MKKIKLNILGFVFNFIIVLAIIILIKWIVLQIESLYLAIILTFFLFIIIVVVLILEAKRVFNKISIKKEVENKERIWK